MEMGERIKMLREQRGMTLEELGNKVGVGKSTVRKWETGAIANMRRDKIQKLADALGVSPGYLMGWDDAVSTSGHHSSIHSGLPRSRRCLAAANALHICSFGL